MNKQEHLDWCKQRALEFVEAGDNQQALASMITDLGKHPDTLQLSGTAIFMGGQLYIGGHLSTAKEMTDWINGF